MEPAAPQAKLIVIVGPTASGKSDLAMRVAREFNGEIICADSRTIYKGMDIGTAKPSIADQKVVPHWGLDLINPAQKFSAADFKKYAEAKVKDIQKRGKLAILAGGTGLYVDSVVFDFSFVEPKKLPWHHRLFYPWYSIEKLQKMVQQRDWELPENVNNRRHLVNTLRRGGQAGSRKDNPHEGAYLAGLRPPDAQIKRAINGRADSLLERGIIEETQQLLRAYGPKKLGASGGIAYTIIAKLIRGDLSEEQAIEQIKSAEWRYVKRQKTWFKRNKFTTWFESKDDAFESICRLLNT